MTTFLGEPVTLVGQRLQIGETAPDLILTTTDLAQRSLSDFADKEKVVSAIPSIDIRICLTQTRTFNKELSDVEDIATITVSVDLPLVQARWCGIEGLERAVMMSDYYDSTFGKIYRLLVKEWHLLVRAVLISDKNNKFVYAECLENVNSEPNYQAATEAVEAL